MPPFKMSTRRTTKKCCYSQAFKSMHSENTNSTVLRTPPKSSAKKRKAKDTPSVKKKRKPGSQPPYRLSEAMQDVVGTDILPRPQVVSKLWVYIKANNLQNPNDKREILCDDKLQRIMKKRKVTMFQMNTHIGEHLLEKLDRSEYQREPDSDAEENDGDDE